MITFLTPSLIALTQQSVLGIIPPEKISSHSTKIADGDSPYGKAFSHSAKYSPEKREERHKRMFTFCIYEKSYAKYLVHGSIKPEVIPVSEIGKPVRTGKFYNEEGKYIGSAYYKYALTEFCTLMLYSN